MAGNADAVEIMQEHYSSKMTTAIDTDWNEGLNLLNYKCKLKAYLFRNGYDTGLFSGFTKHVQGSHEIKQNAANIQIQTSSYASVYYYWTNKLALPGYSMLRWIASGNGYVGSSDSTNNSSSSVSISMNKARAAFSTGSLSISPYADTAYYYKFGCCNGENFLDWGISRNDGS